MTAIAPDTPPIPAPSTGASTEPVMRLAGLGKTYPNGTVALADATLTIHPYEFVAVIGPSGAGKSTLLRCMNRLNDPTSGRIHLRGDDITAASGGRLRLVRARVGMIFQQFNLTGRLTVLQNVLAGRLRFAQDPVTWGPSVIRRFSRSEREHAFECLRLVGIPEKAYERADSLSGGQQQRVAIARTLAQEPEVMLADEPIASLDPRSATAVMDALRRVNRERGVPVLVNLHQVDVAREYATRIIGMRAGRIVFDGPPHALTQPALLDIYGEAVGEAIGEAAATDAG